MLESERLFIRPAKLEDAESLYLLNTDPAVTRFTGDAPFSSPSAAREFIGQTMIPQFASTKTGRFMVFTRENVFIGWCGLKFHSETGDYDLGYRFFQKYWGHGFATESSRVCLKYGFEELQLERIIAKSMPENVTSIKVLQKIGMEFKGYIHDRFDPHPFNLFEITRKNLIRCDG